MDSFEALPWSDQIDATVGALASVEAAEELVITVEVTAMTDDQVAVLHSKYAAAGIALVMYDDQAAPRPGTLPLAARDLDEDHQEPMG